MDFTHCLDDGDEIPTSLANINNTKDDRIYGAFPEFGPFIKKKVLGKCLHDLRMLDNSVLSNIMSDIPPKWSVNQQLRDTITRFFLHRSTYLVDELQGILWPYLAQQKQLDL